MFLTKGRYNYGYFCAGTILSDTWILTAAHCTTAAKKDGYSVLVYVGKENALICFPGTPGGAYSTSFYTYIHDCAGDHDLSTTSETRSQKIAGPQMIEHPRYNKDTFDNGEFK